MPKIKCEFAKVPEGYICEIKNQYDFYEEQITFHGKHKGKKQNSDVIGLNFSDCSFMILPLNIAEIFPNLKYLSFHDCVGLESIRKKHLEKLTNLTHLYIVKCGLLKLSGDLLKGLKNLESVSFSDNKLTEIDPTIFDGLENLKNVNLLYNVNISTSCITELGENVENIKKEIRLKCQPKITAEKSVQTDITNKLMQLKDEENDKNLNFLKFEVKQLKISINEKEQQIATLSAKQSEHEKIKKGMQKIMDENKELKTSLQAHEILADNQRVRIQDLMILLSKNNQTMKELETLKNENKNLRLTIMDRETLVKNQRQELSILLAKQSKQDQIIKDARKATDENLKLKSCLKKEGTIVDNQRKTIRRLLDEKQKNKSFNNVTKILNDPAFKDFTFNVGKSSFKVHKILFAARSETLAEIFKNNPDAQELNFKDIPEETFKAVYDFVYTNQLPGDVDHVKVFAAAIRLKINDLCDETALQLLDKVDEKNALEILELSNKFVHEQLRQKAFEIIQKKIFPDRILPRDLIKQPENVRKLIELKRKMDEEYEKCCNKLKVLK